MDFKAMAAVVCLIVTSAPAAEGGAMTTVPLPVSAHDVIPTGNDWIALPDIRASDGAIGSFNVLSMRSRGLLQVRGADGRPTIRPIVALDGQTVALEHLKWSLLGYWIPVATLTSHGLEIEITYCAPEETRAAFLHLSVRNVGTTPASVQIGADASWGRFDRVTYQPEPLAGWRKIAAGLFVDDAETLSFHTETVQFAWSLVHPRMHGAITEVSGAQTDIVRSDAVELRPGETTEGDVILAAGLDEVSAPHSAKALADRLDRLGAAAVIARTAAWLGERTRTTGRADLDLLMNRNALFSRFFAWGKTLDTEQLVGITSRSPRYYVSAAYWDRDALLWSFPALLRFDPARAREALDYALGIQLRNTGIHSRSIDGVVLEDGFQLDAAAAPLLALADYHQATGDLEFVRGHRASLADLAATLARVRDAETGLYETWQDSQDEYRRQPFLTYDNVLAWRALGGLATLQDALGEGEAAKTTRAEAEHLKAAILAHMVQDHEGRRIFVAGWGPKFGPLFEDIPPGSLFRLPALGFVSEEDPVFKATVEWLMSPAYHYSHSGTPFGLPGSYRLPFTTSWVVADQLRLAATRQRALTILTDSHWDGGIVSEGIDPTTGRADHDGHAFATAAGYVAATLYDIFGEANGCRRTGTCF
jgi:hypothetical protein